MTKGIDAGPYGSPSRFDPASTRGVYPGHEGITDKESKSGRFERAISIYRAAHSWISQTRGHAAGLDLIWFGQYAPHASQYVPVYVNAAELPAAFDHGSLYKYDESSSYWAHAAVGNWGDRFYRFTISGIKGLQEQQEGKLYRVQPKLELEAASLIASGNRTAAFSLLARHSAEASASDVTAWTKFFREMIAKYKDGQRLDHVHEQYTLAPTKLFYPRSWLESVGYWPRDQASFVAGFLQAGRPATPSALSAVVSVFSTQALLAVVTGLMGVAVGHQLGSCRTRRSAAMAVPLLAE